MGGRRAPQSEAHQQRTCVMCRVREEKSRLLRFVLSRKGMQWDAAHRLPGRGGYIHPRISCWSKLAEVGRWEHAFRLGKGELQRRAVEAGFENVKGMLAEVMQASRTAVEDGAL